MEIPQLKTKINYNKKVHEYGKVDLINPLGLLSPLKIVRIKVGYRAGGSPGMRVLMNLYVAITFYFSILQLSKVYT